MTSSSGPQEPAGVPSVTTVQEADLVRWAFSQTPGRLLMNLELGMSTPSLVHCHVSAPLFESIDGKTGEVDAILWPRDAEGEATVVEVKRIRVSSETFATETPGGLAALAKGAAQANAHFRLGFSRVYLCAVVQVDGRERSGGSWLEGGLTRALLDKVRAAIADAEVDPAVGLLLLELRQPVQKNALDGGGLGLIYSKSAGRQPQPGFLTERIGRLASENRQDRIEW